MKRVAVGDFVVKLEADCCQNVFVGSQSNGLERFSSNLEQEGFSFLPARARNSQILGFEVLGDNVVVCWNDGLAELLSNTRRVLNDEKE